MAERPTNQQRNAEMVRRYTSGETLEEIGAHYGLTRERIRQIVTEVSRRSVSGDARTARQVHKAVAVRKTQEQMVAAYGEFAKLAAQDGMTLEEAAQMIEELDPEADQKHLRRMLMDSGLIFNKIHPGYSFSTKLIHLGMWYLVARKYGIVPLPGSIASNQDLKALREQTGLSETNASDQQVLEITATVESAQDYARRNTVSITGQQYADLRKEAEAELRIKSIRNDFPWPADKQTASKRFDGWSKAVESIGLTPSTLGRPKGLVKFTEAEYRRAIIGYKRWSESQGLTAAAERYAGWVKMEKARGVIRPSGASIRNFHGAWSKAMRSVESA